MNPVVKWGWDESSLEGVVLWGLEGPSGIEEPRQGGAARAAPSQPSLCPVPAGTADVVLWSILISPGEAFTELSSTGKWRCSTHPALQIHQGEDGKGDSSSLPVTPQRLCPSLVTAD